MVAASQVAAALEEALVAVSVASEEVPSEEAVQAVAGRISNLYLQSVGLLINCYNFADPFGKGMTILPM